MPFTIPDKGEGANDVQSVLFQEYLDVIVAGINGIDCVLSGCAVTAQGSPDMTCAVAKGAVLSNGTLFPVTAGNVTIGTADATNPRLDLVVVNNAGTKAVRAGTAAANPKPPARSANDVVIAVVYIPATDTTINSNQITDMRMQRTQGPICIAKKTTAQVQASSSSAVTYFTVTLPSGLFLAGKILHVRVYGNYLVNAAVTPTWTLTIAYGGSNIFAGDATLATAQDADRGAWMIDFYLTAQGNADQSIDGFVLFQTPGAKTAPTTGRGDMGVLTHNYTPFNGALAIDSDAADRTLNVQWTMGSNSASVETVCEGAIAELL